MGAASESVQMTKMLRGSLIKLYHLLKVDFEGESYQDVGAFTPEHLNYAMKLVKGEPTYLEMKQELTLSSNLLRNRLEGDQYLYQQSLFRTNLSTSLIDAYVLGRLRFLGDNNFTNVWLINAV